MKSKIYYQVFHIILFVVILGISGCGHHNETDCKLDLVDSLMEERPDSALCILDNIQESDLIGDRRKARYALLKSMALDKNYIDTTTFDVLQPAIDYYLKNGNADEKLRTLYYQGVIYANAGSDDLAMQSYLNGVEVNGEVLDSLTLARLLVAQSTLYYKQYRLSNFIENNLCAARIFHSLGKPSQQLRCYCRALNAKVILKNKIGADSLVAVCKSLEDVVPECTDVVSRTLLAYIIEFGDEDVVKNGIAKIQDSGRSHNSGFILAHGYLKIGELDKAMYVLNNVSIDDNIMDSLNYWSVKTEIFEKMGNHEQALDCYRNYSRLLEDFYDSLFSNELLFSEKKHEMEMESLIKLQKKDNLLKLCLGGIILLICIGGLFFYRSRLNKAARTIAEQNAEKLQLEADNLRLEFGQLEEEHQRLTTLLEDHREMAGSMKDVIRKRLDLLNSLLAKEITSNDSYAKPYREWIDSIRNDQKAFMNSTRMVFQASNPEFIDYLKEHSLTDNEINYVCLYALGLRGKEVGEYIQLKRHYNISSEIRRKLGIDGHSANLGPYVRQIMTQLSEGMGG